MQLSGLKVAWMIMVLRSLSGCENSKPTGTWGSDGTWGSRFLANSSRKFTEIHEKTGAEWH